VHPVAFNANPIEVSNLKLAISYSMSYHTWAKGYVEANVSDYGANT
jgi:hypothetical protein